MQLNYLFVLFAVCSFGQALLGQEAYCKIEIDSTFRSKNQLKTFSINGIDIPFLEESIEVPVNGGDFDLLSLRSENSTTHKVLMKLKPDEVYLLAYNSCSYYTLAPVSNPLQGMTKFVYKGKQEEEYLVGIDYFRPLAPSKVDSFYYSPPSGMCSFYAKDIEIRTVNRELLFSEKFHFLHGEKLVITFDSVKGIKNFRIDGYVKNRDEYRHYYDRN